MKEKEINEGYEIIERFPVGEQGFALGHSETAPAPYPYHRCQARKSRPETEKSEVQRLQTGTQ